MHFIYKVISLSKSHSLMMPSLRRDGVRELELFHVSRSFVGDISALVSRTLVLMMTVAAAVSAPTAAAVACGHQVTLVGVMIVRLGIGAVGEEVADLALDDLMNRHWLDAGKIVQLDDRNEISLTYPVV